MPDRPDPAAARRFAASGSGALTGLTWASLFALLATMACLRYLALSSTVFDLGIYLSNIFAIYETGSLERAVSGHAQPLLILYAKLHAVFPRQTVPLVLLILQAGALSLPALMAGRRYGILAAAAYALFFPVWYNALFDFHPDHLLAPILFLFFLAAEDRRFGRAFLLGAAAALVKEPYALESAACGLYLLFLPGGRRAGLALAAFGALYFWIVAGYALPFFTMDQGVGLSGGAFAWLGATPAQMVRTMLGHPLSTAATVLADPARQKYLLALLAGLAFLPLLRPLPLLPALPILGVSLLASLGNYHSLGNHYTAGLIGPFFYAFCRALDPARGAAEGLRLPRGVFSLGLLTALSAAHVMLSPSPVSRLFHAGPSEALRAEAYEPSARDAAILKELLLLIPEDPAIPVVAQNSLNWGAAAQRLDYNSFPLGVFEPHPVQDSRGATWADFTTFVRTGRKPDFPIRHWRAEYLILDTTRPWYLVDRGCGWRDGRCADAAVARDFEAAVARAKSEFETLFEADGFSVLRRRPVSQAAEIIEVSPPEAGPGAEATVPADPAVPTGPAVQPSPAAPTDPTVPAPAPRPPKAPAAAGPAGQPGPAGSIDPAATEPPAATPAPAAKATAKPRPAAPPEVP